MGFEQFIFYVFAALLVFAALRVVTVRNPVHAVLFLVLAFFSSAALWLLLEAEFLALVLVLVYVGAVMVLFLFVIMMLDIDIAVLREGFTRYVPVGVFVGLAIVVEMALVLIRYFALPAGAAPKQLPADYSNTRMLGDVLYTHYVYSFEIAAAILLVAIIAAIVLTLRRRPDTKHQDPARQVRVRRRDRIRIVKMDAEKKTP
ncbi:NADH-quinone oxidoreductase subunit J [bacterium BMS3Bbin12]|nr:NADH-quinone oxidoreductase subunit J [bacterium BMS3Abin12]GBE47728.1 NADH-quinone oxidoreductase subunit J [bacterium BMS3Bbin12]GBE49273.1 NADH-quinone oxidoreductase subunit J [bacterium BMS3Bbin13]HDJ86600.1 NADH-quinone oxidoreductase subunit J [Chromatiales bacterium]HDK03439.1 NADH-quinone oxidoreductase subunit J [Gammaproteobacteria bacterium]